MFDMSSLMSRIVLRQQSDAKGNPTDDGLISISRLHQFMRPMFFRKKSDQGYSIRLEWLGYQAEASGENVLAVEDELLDKVLKSVKGDSKKFTIRKNV
jgi:hypothetical protein